MPRELAYRPVAFWAERLIHFSAIVKSSKGTFCRDIRWY